MRLLLLSSVRFHFLFGSLVTWDVLYIVIVTTVYFEPTCCLLSLCVGFANERMNEQESQVWRAKLWDCCHESGARPLLGGAIVGFVAEHTQYGRAR